MIGYLAAQKMANAKKKPAGGDINIAQHKVDFDLPEIKSNFLSGRAPVAPPLPVVAPPPPPLPPTVYQDPPVALPRPPTLPPPVVAPAPVVAPPVAIQEQVYQAPLAAPPPPVVKPEPVYQAPLAVPTSPPPPVAETVFTPPPPPPPAPPVVTLEPSPPPPPRVVTPEPPATVFTPTPPPPPPTPVPVSAPPVVTPPVAPTPTSQVLPSSSIQPTTTPVTPTTTASPTMATATTSNIDPTIQPYLSYGLSEAQKLYQGGGPQYYGGQTYVSPSEQTKTGLQALEQRAAKGSPLTGAAQSQLQGTIQGNYLSGNPFFQGAFNPAAQAAESKFKQSLGDIGSAASKAGRYGSGAMSTMQQGASGQFAKTLADTAGTLAYQNYSDERGRQQAATMAAPAMAQTDYQDIQQMLNAGQMREGYTGQQQQADIQKFNFLQTQPQQNLANFLSGVYGNPLSRAQQGGTTQAQPSGWQNLLGGAATAAGIYKTLGGTQGISQIGNWLTGGGSSGSGTFVPDPNAVALGSNWWD